MAQQIIHLEEDNTLSFGDYTLQEKKKVEDFPFHGDLLKVKTYKTMTKLEKNGMFLYESVPGTSVKHFKETEEGVSFVVEAAEDVQITLGMAEETSYEVFIDKESTGIMETNMGGKLIVSVEIGQTKEIEIEVKKA